MYKLKLIVYFLNVFYIQMPTRKLFFYLPMLIINIFFKGKAFHCHINHHCSWGQLSTTCSYDTEVPKCTAPSCRKLQAMA